MRAPGDIKYYEEAAPVAPDLIKRHTQRLRKVHTLCPRLLFKHSDLEKAAAGVLENHMDEWNLTSQQQKDFKRQVPLRLQMLFQHVAAALRRRAVPKWVQ